MRTCFLLAILALLFSCSETNESTATGNSNENTTKAPDKALESRISQILDKMSIDEKIGQLALRGKSSRDKDGLSEELLQSVRDGEVGAFLNVMDTAHMRELQRVAAEESEHGIPLIFARDVIHGFKTIFPIPLGQAASWNPTLVQEGSRIAAEEASSVGIRWTFAPMLDICQDSRWGRIAESPGEDPYLASKMAGAYIRGFQGEDLSDPTRIAACAKHFIGYGAPIGGRDYNTAIISDELFYNLYLTPFRTAVDEGAATVMSSFNEVNGVPATGNERILMDVLREELGFNGFVVSDWNSVTEMIPHGFAADEREAARLSADAGLDMEMTSRAYENHLRELIKDGEISEDQLDFYVSNILRIKLRLGLFENPYIPADHPGKFYKEADMQSAKQAAIESSVLLKNDGILPLPASRKVLITGPLSNHGHEQLGTWTFDGEGEQAITPSEAMSSQIFVQGMTHSRDKNLTDLGKVKAAAASASAIVFVAGEEAILSGEAHSRASIKLPGAQEAYIKELAKTGKPLILVIMAGRPINVSDLLDDVDAILMMWHPGTMGGPALKEILRGKAEATGRLPVSWPKMAGQLPYFYNHKNTGRPAKPESFVGIDDIPIKAWQSSLGNESHYLDAGFEPLYPFGYGLSYTTFEYSGLSLSQTELSEGETMEIKATVTNSGARKGTETAQFYIRDRFGRITRPVRELKGFEKLSLDAGASQEVSFTLSYDDLKYHDSMGTHGVEPGTVDIFVGGNSNATLTQSIELK